MIKKGLKSFCKKFLILLSFSFLFILVVYAAVPSGSFTNDIETGPVQSDTITIEFTDSDSDIVSSLYGYSTSTTCDSSTILTSTGTLNGTGASSSITIVENTQTNNGNYICASATDTTDTTFIRSANVLNIDITDPVFESFTVSSNNTNGSYAKEDDIITITLNINPADTWKVGNNATFSIGNETGINTNNFTFSNTAITSRNRTYTITGSQTGEFSFTALTFLDLADNTITGFTSPYSPSSNITVDTTLPVISFTDDVSSTEVTSDTINITVTDTNADTGSYEYGFSSDSTCNSSDTFGNSFTSGNSFTISNASNNSNFICVRAEDLAGNISFLSSANALNITNSAPVINDTSFSVNENSLNGTSVGTQTGSDADGDTLSYSITGGNTGNTFTINSSTAQITVSGSLDFETTSSYSLIVQASDGTLTDTATIAITITDVNEAPTNIILSSTSVAENAGANAPVGTLSKTDPDSGNTDTYTLVSGTGDSDNTSFNISGTSLRLTASADFETKSSYSIRLNVNDGTNDFEKQFTITITDVNEAPVINDTSFSVNENSLNGTSVGTQTGSDADGDTLSYSITGGNTGNTFTINSSTAQITVSGSLDFETTSSYSLIVQASDGTLTDTATIAITITDVNEAPTNIILSSTSVAENAGANAPVGTLSKTDPDSGNTDTYTLVSGTGDSDNTSFNISGTSLRLTASADFETKSSYSIRLNVNDGTNDFEKQFTITITDVNEAPTNIILSSTSVAENAGANAPVGTLSKTDPDSGNTDTYTLVSGTGDSDNTSFNISGTSLRLTASADFETKSSYSIRLNVNDGTNDFEKQFTITITDVNEAPVINDTSFSVNENSLNGTSVGTQTGSDADGDTLSYSITGGNTGNTFTINSSTAQITVSGSLDFETTSSYSLIVQASDGTLTDTATIAITITDVNEAPTNIILSSTSVAENAGANAPVGTLSKTDPDSGNTDTYTLVSGTGDSDNTSFNISGTSLRLTASADFETKSSYSIRLNVNDGTNDFEKQFTITITDVNEAPTNIILSSTSVAENAGANAPVGTLSKTDPDSGNTDTYTLVSGTGDSDNTSFNISGTSLRLTASADFETKSSYSIRLNVNDGTNDFEKQFTITITDVNEAPTNIILSSTSVAENAGANAPVGTLSKTDPDSGNTDTYTLVSGTGDSDNTSFNISGTSLRLTASADFETKSSYSIRLNVNDGTNDFEKQFTITITDVNEAPTNIILSSTSVAENAGANAPVGTLSKTDPDSGNTDTYTLVSGTGDSDNTSFNISGTSLRLTASADFETKSSYSIRLNVNDGTNDFEKQFTITITDVNEAPTNIILSSTSVAENAGANAPVGTLSKTDPDSGNTDTYTLVSGTGDSDNTSFNISGTSLRLTASADFETKSSYSIRLNVNDGTNDFEKQFTITITDVNEAPTNIILSSTSVAENAGANAPVGTLSKTDPDSGNTDTYTLVSGTGDSDNTSFNISGTSLRLTASADFETKSSYSIRLNVNDGTNDFEKQFTITITDVNEAPTNIILSSTSVAENAGANAPVGTLSKTDPDSGNTDTYTLVSGTGDSDNTSFNISGTSLRLTASADFETKSSYSIRLNVNDGTNDFEKQFTITITDVNEAPTNIILSSTSVAENAGANAPVGTLSKTDPDSGNTDTYTLVSGTGDSDNTSFNISGTSLRLTASADFETKSSYSIRLNVNDGTNDFEKQFTITITDVNEAPTNIILSSTSVAENAGANAPVGTLSKTDPDSGNTDTYTLVSGTGDSDNTSFNISGTSLRLTASADFETKSSYSIRLNVNDGTNDFEKQFTITITDVNEAPTNIILSSTSVAENAGANAPVGTLSKTDPDSGNTDTYTLVSGTGDSDNTSFNISGTSLRLTASADFETKSSYSIRLNVNDGTNDFEKQFTITITDVNEAPTNIILSSTSVAENAGANAPVGTLSKTDPDSGNTDTYTLVSGTGDSDNTSFNISGTSLRLTASADFETKSSYSIRLNVNDGTNDFEKQFTITITDVNEAPTNIILSSTSVAENAGANAPVGTLSKTDPDSGNTDTYTLVSGTGDSDNTSFNISGTSLRLTASADFETKSSYSIRLNVNDGTNDFEKQFTITITDVNEAPTNIILSSTSVAENAGANAPVGTLSKTDPDSGNTDTYTLVSGTGDSDNTSFNISGTSLRLTASADFETKSSYSIRLNVNDGTNDFEKQFTITITDVNEAPTNIILSSTSVAENAGANAPVGTLSKTDPDSGNTDTYTLVSGTGDSDNTSFNISGTSLRLTASADFETKSSYSIRLNVNDGTNDFEKQFTITITDVNEAPTNIILSSTSVAENAGANAPVGTLSKTDPDSGNTDTYTLVSGTGDSDNTSFNISGTSLRLTASADFETKSSYSIRLNVNDGTNDFEKQFTITITDVNEAPTNIILSSTSVAENAGANAPVGTLSKTDPDSGNTDTYTLVSGTGDSDNTSFNISGTSLRLTASADFETKSSYSIRLNVNDGTNDFEKQFTITITDVNEAPTNIILSSTSVAENAGANAPVGTLSKTDPDSGNTDTYTLVSGTGDSDNTSFNISGTSLRLTASADFETKSSYSIRLNVNDGTNDFEKQFTITITDVNEAPTNIILSSTSVAENAGANAPVGTLSKTDPDSGNTDTYTLVSGTGDSDNTSFNISGTSLRLTASADFETKSSYSIRLNVNDGTNDFEKQFTITITDVNEAPTNIILSSTSVAENAGANAPVGTLSKTDPDSGNTDTYTLVSGTGDSDNTSFNISGTSLRLTASADFETKSSYSIRLNVNDGTNDFEKQFTITITDVNEAPTNIILSSTSVAENAGANAPVGTLSKTDPDSGNTDTYTLVSGTGDSDNTSFNISGTSLRLTASADFETKSSYSIRLNVNDGTNDFEKQFTITITDVNDIPVINDILF